MAVQYYAASSLDGFIADSHDKVDFLDALPQPEPSSYEAFIADVGALVMGATSYQFILDHVAGGGEWPYTQHAWVFTHRDFPARQGVTFVSGSVAEALPEIETEASGKNIWIVGGGDLAGQFHDIGRLDELIITVASTTLGAGRPVLPRAVRLRLAQVTPMGEGFVELRYTPQPDESSSGQA